MKKQQQAFLEKSQPQDKDDTSQLEEGLPPKDLEEGEESTAFIYSNLKNAVSTFAVSYMFEVLTVLLGVCTVP